MTLHALKRATVLLLASITAAGVLAACGGDDDTAATDVSAAAPAGVDFNDADVAFAQGMIPHHNQAVEMSRIAASRASSPAVKKLAAQISAAQAPEIEQMQGFLADWDRPLAEGMDTMAGMEDMAEMPGMETMAGMENMANMATGDEIAALEKAKGKNFDELFLQLMLQHHESAVDMAETEQADGENAEAKALAGEIIETQSAEIARMEKLLKA